MTDLLVYGSLKKGGGLHGYLEGSQFIGTASLPGFGLYDLGAFPGIVPAAGVVHGEVYAVDRGTLALIDRVEGVPHLYRRERLPALLRRFDDEPPIDVEVEAYVFNGTVAGDQSIPAGVWPVGAARKWNP
jgi:gamma-glutamylcyclotransferase (GGCT)/AIG2-like uncharacterized protein YtfP